MKEFLVRLKGSVRKLPCRLGRVQHNQGPQNIRPDKNLRIPDTSVHMTLRGKMDHPVDIILVKNLHDSFTVTDVRFYKGIVISVFDIFQIFKISCISQFVHIDDTDLIVIFLKHVMNIIGSDKSCAACYQVCSHFSSS